MNKRTKEALAEIKALKEIFSGYSDVKFLSVPVLVRMDDGKRALVCALDDYGTSEAIAVVPGKFWADANGKFAQQSIIDICGLWDGSDI